MNASLRDMRPEDAGWLDGWLGGCALASGYRKIDVTAPAKSLQILVRSGDLYAQVIATEDDTQRIGIVIYRSAPVAAIDFVGVVPAYTRRGYGHAGAMLVEGLLRDAGAQRIYAAASAEHGISVYFWIRLGFRPLLKAEWPVACEGMIWVVREDHQGIGAQRSGTRLPSQSKAFTP